MKELIKYFVNLLILQYRNKPRAKGTIEALAKQTFADSTDKIFPIEVQNSYNLDTAVGTQLDVIGKYVGYDRTLPFPVNDNFIYAEYDGSSNPDTGYSDYYVEKDTMPYAEYRYSSYEYYRVSDDTYRRILKMQSELKNKPLSLANIDEALKNNFDIPEGEVNSGEIYLVEGDKTIEYHISKNMYPVLNSQEKLNAFFQKYFPRPMGCSMSVVRDDLFLKMDSINGAELDENYIFTNNQADVDPRHNEVKYFKTKEQIDARNHTKDIEFRIKFKPTATRSGFFCADPSEISWNYFLSGYIFASRQLGISINANAYGSVYVTLDNWYWVKMTHAANSNSWVVWYSTDGTNYSEVYTYSYSLTIPAMYMWIGAGASTGSTYGLSGSVDFKDTDIIIDGKSVLWSNKRII